MPLTRSLASSLVASEAPTMLDHRQPEDSSGSATRRLEDADPVGFLPLIREYVETLPARLSELASAWTAGDLRMLADGACRLRCSGGLYGYDLLSESAGALEDAIRLGEDAALVHARFETLTRLIERVVIDGRSLRPADAFPPES